MNKEQDFINIMAIKLADAVKKVIIDWYSPDGQLIKTETAKEIKCI